MDKDLHNHPALKVLRDAFHKTIEMKRRFEEEGWDINAIGFEEYSNDIDDLLWDVFDGIWEGYGFNWGGEKVKVEIWDLLWDEFRGSKRVDDSRENSVED